MRSFHLSPVAYRGVTLAALVALVVIILTGGAVRLTGSGLGCPEWPSCEPGSLAPRDATSFHAMVEFVNRSITGLVSAAVVLAVLGALVRRPRRRDLTWLAIGLVAGVMAQIVLGGVLVLFELWPPLVMGHFLLSMVLVANAVVLHHRAGLPDGARRPEPVVAPELRTLTRWLVAASAVVVFTGTLVTAAGPHGGDDAAERLPLFVPDVARIHGISVVLLVAGTLGALWLARRTSAPATVRRRGHALLGVLAAQAGLGYTQYFTGVPEILVGLHILGAVAVWTAVLRFGLGMTEPRPEPDPDPAAAAALVAA